PTRPASCSRPRAAPTPPWRRARSTSPCSWRTWTRTRREPGRVGCKDSGALTTRYYVSHALLEAQTAHGNDRRRTGLLHRSGPPDRRIDGWSDRAGGGRILAGLGEHRSHRQTVIPGRATHL